MAAVKNRSTIRGFVRSTTKRMNDYHRKARSNQRGRTGIGNISEVVGLTGGSEKKVFFDEKAGIYTLPRLLQKAVLSFHGTAVFDTSIIVQNFRLPPREQGMCPEQDPLKSQKPQWSLSKPFPPTDVRWGIPSYRKYRFWRHIFPVR